MTNIMNLIPEIILFASLISILILKPNKKIVRILCFSGVAISISAIVSIFYIKEEFTLSTFFKIYISIASLLFLTIYGKKHTVLEHASVLGVLISSLILFSFNNPLIVFCSMSMILISLLSFSITREHLSEYNNVVFIISTIISMILYKVSPTISLLALIIIGLWVLIRTKNRDIEALFVFLIIPIIVYPSIATLFSKEMPLAKLSFAIIGSLLLLTASILIMYTKKEIITRSSKYTLFYIGDIFLILSIGTPEAISLAVMMLLLIPFTYSEYLDELNISHFAMIPIFAPFIIKLSTARLLVLLENWYLLTFLGISTVIFWFYGAKELSNNKKENVILNKRPIYIKVLSIIAVSFVVIFFNYIQGVLKISMQYLK
ncbi:MAG TPA: hypothetical protein PK443_01315 [bacterium]|nr:hypothetical protein [bacterium]